MGELERVKGLLNSALQVVESAASQISRAVELHNLEGLATAMQRDLAIINKRLNPPPETETVEVERWAAYWPDGVLIATFDTEELASKAISNDVNAHIAKLTGHFQRPKPVKVERSVEFPCSVTSGSNIRAHFSIAVNSEDAATKRDLMAGKDGVMTFTWQE